MPPRVSTSCPGELSILHFNARSIRNKFDEVSADVLTHNAAVVCVTETWVNVNENMCLCNIDGYRAFSNCRANKTGGGSLIYVDSNLPSRSLSSDVTANDSYNMCAVLVGEQPSQLLVVSVYRAPWATTLDTKELCSLLESTVA